MQEALGELASTDCGCREQWRDRTSEPPERPLADRVLEAYRDLAREHGLADWWAGHSAALEKELRAERPEPGHG